MVIEESVLRYGIGDAAVMAEQLDHLLALMELPSVWIGVIPFSVERRPMWTLEAFTCFDQERVNVELPAAQVTVTVPREVRLYLDAFDKLAALAVSGDQARDPDPRRNETRPVSPAQLGATLFACPLITWEIGPKVTIGNRKTT